MWPEICGCAHAARQVPIGEREACIMRGQTVASACGTAPEAPPFRATMPALSGSVAEWFKAAVLKTADGVTHP
ncbi:hypothetical protein CBM2637_A100002 [Cupriavidus taiwanensis]|nr:hypothetical protein CBM2637_A100002 [Cupriavidus taiwanensis]